MRKLILKCGFSPGDIVMLTAAVRDLHIHHPGRFLTDVRTPCPALWKNNPYITALRDEDPEAERIDCIYPLISKANQLPYHSLHGFIAFLSERLGLPIPLTRFAGDIHVSDLEKSWMSQVHELTGEDTPFWIVVCGGKFDVTIKWWDPARYQEIVDHFQGRIQFVQVGEKHDYHPLLKGVIDLRGKTTLRQLVRLVYHSQGILCPVTCLMHLAAAVEVKGNHLSKRPCVVIAGAREPAHWEAYPHHQFIHTNGSLPCCQQGGCWKARTFPLNDGDERDGKLCVAVNNALPACMDLISAQEVIRRIEMYYKGGALQYLNPKQARATSIAVAPVEIKGQDPISVETARTAIEQCVAQLPTAGPEYKGRGIVICGGGVKYFPCAWVCIRMLRYLGCTLPIQLWYLGEQECNARMRQLIGAFGVECVDALQVRANYPARILKGWELKPYSILNCSFEEVLLLDSDNVCTVNPDFLFETNEYRRTGAIFWPDYGRLAPSRLIWKLCGVPYQDEPEFETGQILVNKARCWKALRLTMWLNENSDFYYQHIHGDKDTFHMAFRKLNVPYSMPSEPIHSLPGVMCQHDFKGNRIFQHRNGHKWRLFKANVPIEDFLFEDLCLGFLEQLRIQWDGTIQI